MSKHNYPQDRRSREDQGYLNQCVEPKTITEELKNEVRSYIDIQKKRHIRVAYTVSILYLIAKAGIISKKELEKICKITPEYYNSNVSSVIGRFEHAELLIPLSVDANNSKRYGLNKRFSNYRSKTLKDLEDEFQEIIRISAPDPTIEEWEKKFKEEKNNVFVATKKNDAQESSINEKKQISSLSALKTLLSPSPDRQNNGNAQNLGRHQPYITPSFPKTSKNSVPPPVVKESSKPSSYQNILVWSGIDWIENVNVYQEIQKINGLFLCLCEHTENNCFHLHIIAKQENDILRPIKSKTLKLSQNNIVVPSHSPEKNLSGKEIVGLGFWRRLDRKDDEFYFNVKNYPIEILGFDNPYSEESLPAAFPDYTNYPTCLDCVRKYFICTKMYRILKRLNVSLEQKDDQIQI